MKQKERTGDGLAAKRGLPPGQGRRRADVDLRKIEPQIGRALRSVYDETVSESIPADLLALLGKLG